MKKMSVFFAILFIWIMNSVAQTPGVKYQTVVRDASGNLYTNQPVAFRLSIISGTPFGFRYAEFVVPLIKAVQEQQLIIEELKQRIQNLENK
ncbi:MAG: hypothetical protein FJY10_03060 [Bacteroidetes bacterium]|nr:hypothetical protein [Bacteroidota bacterium]